MKVEHLRQLARGEYASIGLDYMTHSGGFENARIGIKNTALLAAADRIEDLEKQLAESKK